VSLLGNDISALKDLEYSVHGITDRHHNWDPGNNARRIQELSKELDELRQRLAKSNRRLREIKERETYEHILCDGTYRGTALQVAQQVSRGRDMHGWLQIRIALDEDPPLTDQEALELLSLFRKLTPELVNEIKKPVVRLEELPTPEEFVRLCDAERQAKDKHKPFIDLLQTETSRKLKAASTAQRARLREALDKLSTTCAGILNRSHLFIGKAVNDVLSGRDRNWQELHKRSSELLQGLLEEAHAAEGRKLKLPQEHAREIVLADAKSLLDHLQKGGGFGIPGFRPKPVKSARYLIKETRVDGRPCDNVDSLKALVATLEVSERLDKLWAYWKHSVDRVAGSRPDQVYELEDLNKALETALHLRNLVEDAEAACKAIDGLTHPAWHIIDEIELYRRILEGILSEQNLEEARAIFAKADRAFRTALTYPEAHPVVTEGHQALSDRDERSFGVFYAKISSLDEPTRLLSRWHELATRLDRSAPSVAGRLASEYNEKFWDDALARFTDSWTWARLDTWVKEYISVVSETQLSQEVRDIQNRINVTLGRLSAALAWGHCFDRLTEMERQHLVAWKHAMKRIGKGTGKHAEKHRREAREQLEGCRGAIPAWIMPLYRVAESLKPAPNSYDVVIIDEASQAGPDAIFLQYIAKKIVVVGDDMQISPDSIGVPREDVDRLRERYLKDLPSSHIGALGVEETSFFHLAELLFGGRIILREHFRCMPEIIQFSNGLCYKNNPLIPLRQYPPNRLVPVIKVRHVSEGYREGGDRTPRNPPEAQALVDEIARCCREPGYKDKTVGVISLLGEYQTHLIQQKLIESIGPEEIERRNLICGDAYAFQGDERDIIFLSLVAAPDETGMRALTDQKSMRRFNVAASRARDQMWLFHTPTINDFRNKECLRYRLLSYCLNPQRQPSRIEGMDLKRLESDARAVRRTTENHPEQFDSWFEVDVFLKIVDKGYRVIPQFEAAGYFIDLVVEGMRGRLAIECDGDKWHGPDNYEADMQRQRTLERCGWTFWRIRGSEYYHDPDKAIASLWELLDRLHIATGGQDIEPSQDRPN
jgi:very-short-patch-repair endonuclease